VAKTKTTNPAPKPETSARAYHHGNLREALIASALDILETEGVATLSLRAVARRAGVSQTAPYRHFQNKEELLAALAAEGFRGLTARMTTEAERASKKTSRLRDLGRGYVLFAVENPAYLRLMFGPEISDKSAHPDLLQAAEAAFAILSGASAAGTPADDPSDNALDDLAADPAIAALTAWSTVHGLANLLIDGQVKDRILNGRPLDVGALTDLVTAGMEK